MDGPVSIAERRERREAWEAANEVINRLERLEAALAEERQARLLFQEMLSRVVEKLNNRIALLEARP